MPIGPRPSDVARIRRTVAVYKVSSYITGTFLMLLVLMMVTRYGFGLDIEMNGVYGFLSLNAKEQITGINLSVVILTVHGWLYVLYLACDFILWRLVRFPFTRFLWIALGGVIPLLSFFLERQVPRYIERRIAHLDPVLETA